MAITEQRNLATQFEVISGIQAIETTNRWTSQRVLADAGHQHLFQMLATILAEPWNVELDHRADAPIGRLVSGDVLRDASFAITQNGAAAVPGNGVYTMR